MSRTLVVCELLKQLKRVDDAIFYLAAAGYLVEPNALRCAWVSRLDRKEGQINAAAKRRKDGVDGLVAAKPPPETFTSSGQHFDLTGLKQAFLELHRTHITGETIDETEIFALVEKAAHSLGVRKLSNYNADFTEPSFKLIETFFDRNIERDHVTDIRDTNFVAAQVATNRFIRLTDKVSSKLGLARARNPNSTVIQSLGVGGPILKLFLYLAAFIGPRPLVIGVRRFEHWGSRAQFEPKNNENAIPSLTAQARAEFLRTCRMVFGN